MREFFKASWLVLASSIGFGLLLAFTYATWQPRILMNQRLAIERGVREILPEASEIRADTLSLSGSEGQPEELVVYHGLGPEGAPVGHAYIAAGTGFQDRIQLLVGLDRNLSRYRGIVVLSAAETPGFGDALRDSTIFRGQFIGAPADTSLVVVKGPDSDRAKTGDREIISITGATITSESATGIVNRRTKQVRPLLMQRLRTEGAGGGGTRDAHPDTSASNAAFTGAGKEGR